MRRICVLAAIVMTLGHSLRSAALPTLSPSGAAAIDRMFQAAVDKGEIPGAVVAVTSGERVVYLKAFGKQDVASGVPMSTDTLFRIASMTKPVTSVGVMMLYEQGKLRLDDAAGDYVPAMAGREVIATFNKRDGSYTTRAAASPVTIRQLLAHTSGLAYSFTNETALALQQKSGSAISTCRSCRSRHALELLAGHGYARRHRGEGWRAHRSRISIKAQSSARSEWSTRRMFFRPTRHGGS